MFSVSDSYTVTGSTKLLTCWTDRVIKHDASSFYNWEQDNLPLYDLEERTYFNWQSLGYSPSAGIDGITLVVSADAPGSLVNCNSNIFTSVSAAIRILPKVIRFPVVIEVASFGNLGSLELNDLSFTENGSLEIINRNFGKAYSSSAVTTSDPTYTKKTAVHTSPLFSQYKFIGKVYSLDLSSTFANTSAISVSSRVFSAGIYSDTRPQTHGSTAFFGVPGFHQDNGETYDRLHATINNTSLFVTGGGFFDFTPFEISNPTEVVTFDASTTNLISNAEVYPPAATQSTLVGLVFNNNFNSVKIYNCNGPIYIRGFVALGGLTREIGFDIQNSTLFLENCASTRFTRSGFNIVNSNVTILRGIVAYRNYGVSTLGDGTTRKSASWNSFFKDEKLEELDSAAGIRIIDSNINFSSTVDFENTKQQSYNISGKDFLIACSRNYNGWDIKNSVVQGGIARSRSSTFSTIAPRHQTYFTADHNVNNGFLVENSVIDLDGRVLSNNNKRGMKFINSTAKLDSLWIRYNQNEGINAKDSVIFYNKGYPNVDFLFDEPTLLSTYVQTFTNNGQHMKLDNSKFMITPISGLDTKIGTLFFADVFGLNTFNPNVSGVRNLPMAEAVNNSYLNLVGLFVNYSSPTNVLAEKKLSLITANSGSKIHIQGSKRRPSAIAPVVIAESKRKFITALEAENNSEIEINGPFLTYLGVGIGAAAYKNSVINIRPPQTPNGALDISGWTLTDLGNHTTAEIQAYRTCLLADQNSTINLENLGAYTELWARGNLGLSALASGTDYPISEVSSYIRRGSLQLYPRINYAQAADIIGSPVGDEVDSTTLPENLYNQDGGSTGDFNYWLTNNIFNAANQALLSSVTDGGWAVRALNNSVVNVKNVHFPAGWWNASGSIYDVSGESAGNVLCNRTFLWQFGQGSKLHANYLSVSGLYPEDASYYGPGSVWLSGASQIAYGAPLGTPDTSSLSVRDFFGALASNAWPKPGGGLMDIGYSSPKNRGPFRLYVSVDPAANNLTFFNATANYGYIPQVFAQGYNFSGNASSIPQVSSLYLSLGRFSGSNFVTSGFYYCSAFVAPVSENILLDESAANTFANAKNGALGWSGRPKICTIYRPYTIPAAGDSSDTKHWGRGILSINTVDIEKDN